MKMSQPKISGLTEANLPNKGMNLLSKILLGGLAQMLKSHTATRFISQTKNLKSSRKSLN